MALKQSLEKNGLFLFRYRGQIPVFIFLLGLPFIYFSYYTKSYFNLAELMGGSTDTLFTILTIVGIIVSVAGMWIRAYTIGTTPRGTSGRNTKEQVANELNSTGIYSTVRHPLYLGNYLMWAGLLIFIGSIPLFLVTSLLYWVYYERIMFAEECFLEKQFGQKYIDWSLTVPPFVQKLPKRQYSFFVQSCTSSRICRIFRHVAFVCHYRLYKKFRHPLLDGRLYRFPMGTPFVVLPCSSRNHYLDTTQP